MRVREDGGMIGGRGGAQPQVERRLGRGVVVGGCQLASQKTSVEKCSLASVMSSLLTTATTGESGPAIVALRPAVHHQLTGGDQGHCRS
jgi:hypothetical protein